MKKVVLSAVAALAVTAAAPAFAADLPSKAPKVVAPAPPPSPWDIAFGSAIMNDYIFRGVTQSDHRPSVAAYFEPRYNINSNWQLYAGISGESIKFANNAAAEIDFYGGVRPTFGPLAFDVGFWYYYYPGGQCYGNGPLQAPFGFGGSAGCWPAIPTNGNVAKSVASFYEIYGKVAYTWTDWVFGANFYYSPNFLNLGADGEYLSGTIKFTAPEKMAIGPFGWYVSGEFGHQWLGTSDAFYGCGQLGVAFPPNGFGGCAANNPNGIPYADYNTWNVGLGLTWKVFTLDLRYYDTDLSKANCNAFTSDPTAGGFAGVGPAITAINAGPTSSWCGASFVAKLSADLTLGSLK